MNIPDKINRYEIKEKLGKGGMSHVYLAFDPTFQRDVAIKLLVNAFMDEEISRKRFEKEARTIAKLEHFAIVPVYDFGREQDQAYLVMRAMSGTLADRMEIAPLRIAEIDQILERICAALDKAHANQVIHRDLKPANIFFDDEGLAYLGDFGIAYHESGTRTGSIIGTANYMAPEQAKGQVLDRRTDVYQMGVILFELLAGRPPYKGDNTAAVLYQHVSEPIPEIQAYNPDVSPIFQDLIDMAMAKDPADRPQSAAELYTQFKRAARGSRPIKRLSESDDHTRNYNRPEVDQIEQTKVDFTPTGDRVGNRPTRANPASRRAFWIGAFGIGALLLATLGGAVMMQGGMLDGLIGEPNTGPVTGLTEVENDNIAVVSTPPTPIVVTLVVTPKPEEPDAAEEAIPPTETPTPTVEPSPTATLEPTLMPTLGPVLSDLLGGGSGKVAFSADAGSGNTDIFLWEAGETPIQLTTNPFDDFGAFFSPDGSKIAFHGFTGTDWEVFVMDADGTNLRNVTQNSAADDAFPTWSPDGSTILFHSNRDVDFEIFATDANGASLRQLTFNTVDDFGPSWSPDGTKIVFHRRIDGLRQLFSMNEDGSGARQLTFDTDGEALFPQWSPDGEEIVYMLRPSNANEDRIIYLIDAVGGARRTLLSDPLALGYFPRWSPDGEWIIYHQPSTGDSRDIFITRPDGGETQALTSTATRDERMPDFQPFSP